MNYISLVRKIAKAFNYSTEYCSYDDPVYGKIWSLSVKYEEGALVRIFTNEGKLRREIGGCYERSSKSDAARYFIFKLIDWDAEGDNIRRPCLPVPEKNGVFFSIPCTAEELDFKLTLEFGV